MNIFYTSNDGFVPQLGAGICSICENNRAAGEIHFYIGSLGITPEHQAQLAQLGQCYGREVTFLEIGDLRQWIGFDFDTSGWNPIVLARLLADRILPGEVERVLYLDGDTIVRGDLQPLWDTDLGGCILGASIEATMSAKRREQLGLGEHPYVNAGVLLIDLKLWRERRAGQRVLSFYEQNKGKLFANDQDAINGALAGEICILSPKYNFYTMCWYYPYRVLVKLAKPAPYVSKAIFDDALADPVIIHYLGEVRPWRKNNGHKYNADYHHYLSLTPWADAPLETGWETYFFLYRLFLTVFKPFPMFRFKFLDMFFPLLLRYRAKNRKH